MEKVSFLKQMPHDLLQQQIDSSCSLKELPYAGLISSFTAFQNHIIMCDMGTEFYMTFFGVYVFLFCACVHLLISSGVLSWTEDVEAE